MARKPSRPKIWSEYVRTSRSRSAGVAAESGPSLGNDPVLQLERHQSPDVRPRRVAPPARQCVERGLKVGRKCSMGGHVDYIDRPGRLRMPHDLVHENRSEREREYQCLGDDHRADGQHDREGAKRRARRARRPRKRDPDETAGPPARQADRVVNHVHQQGPQHGVQGGDDQSRQNGTRGARRPLGRAGLGAVDLGRGDAWLAGRRRRVTHPSPHQRHRHQREPHHEIDEHPPAERAHRPPPPARPPPPDHVRLIAQQPQP